MHLGLSNTYGNFRKYSDNLPINVGKLQKSLGDPQQSLTNGRCYSLYSDNAKKMVEFISIAFQVDENLSVGLGQSVCPL